MVRLHLINFYFWPFAFIQHQHFNQSHLYQQQQQKLLNVNVSLVCWSVRWSFVLLSSRHLLRPPFFVSCHNRILYQISYLGVINIKKAEQ